MQDHLILTGLGGKFIDESRRPASPDACTAVREMDVVIETPDGLADAALYFPEGLGQWPGVLIWPDIMGLRPVFREMALRLAKSGYVVLVPNPFYRVRPAPVVGDDFSFADPADREAIFGLRATLTNEHIDLDSVVFIDFLQSQKATAANGKIGVHGYCLGGGFAFRSAAALPDRVAAVASFHGSDLATASATSPHRLATETTANYLVEIARNDDTANPNAKLELAEAFEAAKLSSRIDVCAANHGWCVVGSAAYEPTEAEKAWNRLIELYRFTFG
jgi:carboxymethylenebutenolidase